MVICGISVTVMRQATGVQIHRWGDGACVHLVRSHRRVYSAGRYQAQYNLHTTMHCIRYYWVHLVRSHSVQCEVLYQTQYTYLTHNYYVLYSLLLGKSNSHTHHYVLYNIPHYLVPLIRSLRNRVGTKPDHSGHLTSLRPPWAMFPPPRSSRTKSTKKLSFQNYSKWTLISVGNFKCYLKQMIYQNSISKMSKKKHIAVQFHFCHRFERFTSKRTFSGGVGFPYA